MDEELNYNVALGAQMMDDSEEPKEIPMDMMVDGDIRDMITRRLETSRTYYQAQRDIHDKCWNHYRQIYDRTNKEDWQSTIFVPASPKVAEVICSNMHAAQLGPEKPVEYQARFPSFEDRVKDANDILAVDMDKGNFKVAYEDTLRSKCIIGTGIGKVEYLKEYADVEVKERTQEPPQLTAIKRLFGMQAQDQEVTSQKRLLVKDWATYKNVDRYDIYPEPGTVEFCKDRWVIERGKICNYKLLELSRSEDNPLININDDLLMNNPSDVDDPDGDKEVKDAANNELTDETAYMDPDQEHELLEYWGPAPKWMVYPELYGKDEAQYEMVHAWFWLIDGEYVVRRQLTPWRDAEPPYVKDVYIPVPGKFDGIGPLELMMGLQVELNEGVNARQDEINVKLNKPLAVVKDMVAKGQWKKLKAGPGALYVFSNTDDIKKAMMPIDYDGNLSDSWRSTQLVMQEIEEVTAAVKATIGVGGAETEAGGGTLGGQLLNKQVAADRFIMYARRSEIMGLSQAVRKMYQRIYQFKSMEDVSQALGEERMQTFQFVSPEELDMKAKIVPMGVTSMENKNAKLIQMRDEYMLWKDEPWFKKVEHARKMKEIAGDRPDETIFTDEELQQYMQAQQQMEGELLREQEMNATLPPQPPQEQLQGQPQGTYPAQSRGI